MAYGELPFPTVLYAMSYPPGPGESFFGVGVFGEPLVKEEETDLDCPPPFPLVPLS